jgi:imidazolonepropionase-like amidohydrolase
MKRLLLCTAALLAATPVAAETIAITGGKVALGDGSKPIDQGTVVITNGKIVAAGAGVAVPAGARIIDATGKWVSPGLIAGVSTLGLTEVNSADGANDTSSAKSPYSAAIDIASSINPRAQPIQVMRAEGFTRAFVAASGRGEIFGGLGSVIDLGNDMDAVTHPRAFEVVEFGEGGAEAAGGSRPATYLAFRSALIEAQGVALGRDDGYEKHLTKLDAQALVPVVNGVIPLIVHVDRGSDILATLDLLREFPKLKLVLAGASEGWTVAPQIAAAKVPVIAAGLVDLPDSFENLASTQSNVGRMKAAGVVVAVGVGKTGNLKQDVGNLVGLSAVPGATGLDWGAALAAITSAPAKALGLDAELGSLAPGRRADVVIWDGDPLELESGAVLVLIDGVEQPLSNHLTKLRDRYHQAPEGALPKAYER